MTRTRTLQWGVAAGAMIALGLAALPAAAQDRPVTVGRPDTVLLKVSGRVNMDYVRRDSALTVIPNMNPAGGGVNNSVDTVEGELSIRLDLELTEKISAVVEISRQRTDADAGGFGGLTGVVPFFGDGGDVVNDVTLREAHVKAVDFLSPGLTLKMGILDWAFDVRGRGAALAFHPHRSQNLSRNHLDAQDSAAAMAGRYGVDSATELEPIGLQLSYTGGAFTLELVLMPVVNEEGVTSEDEALYAIDAWYSLEAWVGKGSRVGALVAAHNLSDDSPLFDTGSGSRMITVGAGVNLAFQGGIDVYAEGYLQTGQVGRNPANDEIDAAGRAFQVGGRWTSSGAQVLWLELNFTVYSGDDDADEEVGNFLAYESVNDFLIIEDAYFGFDVDTNYTAFKVLGGVAFGAAGGKENVELQVGVGFFSTTEDVLAGAEDEDALGTEVDVKGKYHLSKQLSINLNFGILTGSDLLEEMAGGSSVDGADDSAWLASLGFDLRY